MATNNAVNTSLSGQSGTGAFAGNVSPSLTTPILGVATGTSFNKLTITAPLTSAVLTIADGKTLTVSNSLTFSGTDGAAVNFGAGGSVSYGSSSLTWSAISGTTQAAIINTAYVNQNAGQTNITLPATASLGDRVAVSGLGAGGWVLTGNTGQVIKLGSSTTSSSGSLTATNQFDAIEVVCIIANTTWAARFVISSGLTVL